MHFHTTSTIKLAMASTQECMVPISFIIGVMCRDTKPAKFKQHFFCGSLIMMSVNF